MPEKPEQQTEQGVSEAGTAEGAPPVVGEAASGRASGAAVPPPAQRPRREAKTTSAFTELRAALSDAAAIAAYIREHHKKGLSEPKTMNTFLQAVSNRPDAVYSELTAAHKAEVAVLLERLFSLFSIGKVPMSPAAQELIIRCEQHGVRKPEWAGEVTTLEGQEPSLFTPRELLKKLSALDPLGRLQRQIELCSSVEDLCVCAKKMRAMFQRGPADGGEEQEIEYAKQCQLLSKILSKARRLVSPPREKHTGTAPDEQQAEGDGEGAGNEATVDAEDTGAPQLSKEDRETFCTFTALTVAILQEVLAGRPTSATQQPISKFVHFAHWCSTYDLMTDDDTAIIIGLEDQANADLLAQANQLETVMTLKALTPGDETALQLALDALWTAGKEKHYEPASVDVLSTIATAASANGISDTFKRDVAERLVRTQLALRDNGLQLPRRALRFVNAEQQKVKQAAIAKQLAAEREAEGEAAEVN